MSDTDWLTDSSVLILIHVVENVQEDEAAVRRTYVYFGLPISGDLSDGSQFCSDRIVRNSYISGIIPKSLKDRVQLCLHAQKSFPATVIDPDLDMQNFRGSLTQRAFNARLAAQADVTSR